jgi:nucleoside 2-deoxyribosyltransferase
MINKPKVYLAGQPNEYENNWKEEFEKMPEFDFFDWEFDADQSSPDTFFPQDMQAISKSDYLVANPGIAPSEATWIEIGYFYGLQVKNHGYFCDRLIIIWQDVRNPKWSIEFVKKTGVVVSSVDEVLRKLREIAGV